MVVSPSIGRRATDIWRSCARLTAFQSSCCRPAAPSRRRSRGARCRTRARGNASMNFVSDNAYGATPEILAALSVANSGAVPSYGDDPITARVQKRLSEIFEREVVAHPVVTGTAANALVLATLCPPHGAIFCHHESHIAVDECAAPEFFTHGAKLVHLEGHGAKITPAAIVAALPGFQRGVH